MSKQNILTPVGRLVMGSLYKPSTKDADGNPLVYKFGANAGQPRANYFLALAIPKTGEGHWKHTEWGKVIYSVGVAAFPQTHSSGQFAWKVADGDSQEHNSRGKRNCDSEGFAGNWILRFSGSYAPKVYREENSAYVQVLDQDYIKPGYFVQISGTVDGNGSQQRPGVFLNHSMVAFSGFGAEIHFGPDANSVGFGKAPMPAGALPTPVASSAPLPSVPPAPPAPAPPSTSGPVMTAKAGGTSYQAFKTAGWTDENLVAQGFMVVNA